MVSTMYGLYVADGPGEGFDDAACDVQVLGAGKASLIRRRSVVFIHYIYIAYKDYLSK